MEQHPVPQNISSYEFRLVGDMTLKQFFQLAGGCVVGIVFFQLPIAGIFKYPLTFISVLVGVLSAFVPFQGRPFNQWLVAFFRAIYSPTEYVWSATPIVATIAPTEVSGAVGPSSIRPQPQVFTGFLSFLSSLFSPKSSPKNVVSTPPPDYLNQLPVTNSLTPKPPPPPPPPPPLVSPKPEVKAETPVITPLPSPTMTTFSVAPAIKTAPTPPHIYSTSSAPTTTPKPVLTPPVTPHPVAPAPTPSIVSFPGLPKITPPSIIPPPANIATPATQLTPATTPNILSGIVTDSQNMAISGSTVEIIDSHTGIPARALRTNRLGQFQIAIPLPPGSYIINTEKTGHVFEPVSVQINNTLIPPIIIKSQNI